MRTLTVYFSWSGNTRKTAKQIAAKINSDLFEIRRAVPYSRDYQKCAYDEAKKEVDQHLNPEIVRPLPDLSKYDRIILDVPVWWYTYPMVTETFLKSYPDWSGKKLYVFANSYSDIPSQFETILKETAAHAKNAEVIRGLYNDEIKDLDAWLEKEKL